MLLILFGTKDRRKVEVKGQFICPKCGVERDYEAISVREWFTLFFIPILPTAVRRQNLLDTKWPELRETLAHQVVL